MAAGYSGEGKVHADEWEGIWCQGKMLTGSPAKYRAYLWPRLLVTLMASLFRAYKSVLFPLSTTAH